MSNTTDIYLDWNGGPAGSCRIAYTLNNDQPVRCTMVSDQPLFYMDFEGDIDIEEEFGDEFGFAEIEDGVKSLQEKIATLDKLENRFDEERDTAMTMAAFLDDAAFITEPFGEQARRTADIEFLTAKLEKSRMAAAYIDFAARYGTKIHYDTQVETALYDRNDNQIYINPHIDRVDQILLAARELRRVWQHRNGALLHPLTFHPDQALLVHRSQIADLTVNMVRIAWELQLAGEKDAWHRIENSALADLARSFARESYLDFRTLNNGIAASAVFETWFLSDRVRYEDKKLIQQMLADYHGYVFDAEESSQNITAELIVALGSMPFGKNYLAPYVQTIMEDPVFTEVRDRSNANFLWFIKFERSFRETEQELQQGEDNKRLDNQRDASQNKTRFGDHEETEIITLPRGAAADPSDGEARYAHESNIIKFRQKPGES